MRGLGWMIFAFTAQGIKVLQVACSGNEGPRVQDHSSNKVLLLTSESPQCLKK